jgi:hypothetical protein
VNVTSPPRSHLASSFRAISTVIWPGSARYWGPWAQDREAGDLAAWFALAP